MATPALWGTLWLQKLGKRSLELPALCHVKLAPRKRLQLRISWGDEAAEQMGGYLAKALDRSPSHPGRVLGQPAAVAKNRAEAAAQQRALPVPRATGHTLTILGACPSLCLLRVTGTDLLAHRMESQRRW